MSRTSDRFIRKYGEMDSERFHPDVASSLFNKKFGSLVSGYIQYPEGTCAVDRGSQGARYHRNAVQSNFKIAVLPAKGEAKRRIAIIGKGVCYDSGGMDIKIGSSMHGMHMDKLGAINAMAIGIELSKAQDDNEYVIITPFVENMIGPDAYRAGDVITYKIGGKKLRVEVTNTDAEGRLILADGILEAQLRDCDIIIDLATLTGAISGHLGDGVVGVFGNDEALINQTLAAFEAYKVLAWNLPIFPQYRDCLKAKNQRVADIVNDPKFKGAGASVAAAFLERFLYKQGVKWIHLDIAGISDKDGQAYLGLVDPLVTLVREIII